MIQEGGTAQKDSQVPWPLLQFCRRSKTQETSLHALMLSEGILSPRGSSHSGLHAFHPTWQ